MSMLLNDYKDKIALFVGGAIVGWLVWLSTVVIQVPTRREVIEITTTHSFYLRDKERIFERIQLIAEKANSLEQNYSTIYSQLVEMNLKIERLIVTYDMKNRSTKNKSIAD